MKQFIKNYFIRLYKMFWINNLIHYIIFSKYKNILVMFSIFIYIYIKVSNFFINIKIQIMNITIRHSNLYAS